MSNAISMQTHSPFRTRSRCNIAATSARSRCDSKTPEAAPRLGKPRDFFNHDSACNPRLTRRSVDVVQCSNPTRRSASFGGGGDWLCPGGTRAKGNPCNDSAVCSALRCAALYLHCDLHCDLHCCCDDDHRLGTHAIPVQGEAQCTNPTRHEEGACMSTPGRSDRSPRSTRSSVKATKPCRQDRATRTSVYACSEHVGSRRQDGAGLGAHESLVPSVHILVSGAANTHRLSRLYSANTAHAAGEQIHVGSFAANRRQALHSAVRSIELVQVGKTRSGSRARLVAGSTYRQRAACATSTIRGVPLHLSRSTYDAVQTQRSGCSAAQLPAPYSGTPQDDFTALTGSPNASPQEQPALP